ncbi:ABC transporter permease [Microbacterium sp. KR10-403]|uniref:ABC transporter permease n=1 Tax=Microbacterium sp. KR10-403 TaxID=3158581 RepID=UPI0032E3950E
MTAVPPPLSRKEARETDSVAPAADTATDEKPGVDAAAKAAKRAKAEKIGRMGAIFLMPLILVGMMIVGYLGTMHSPTVRDMPVAVAGTSAAAFADELSDSAGDALAVEVVDSPLDARDRVTAREASAAVVIDGDTATLYTASGAGVSQVTTVTSLVTPVIIGQNLTLETTDLAPLPEGDPSGLGAVFLATALVMAGYLPFSVLRTNSPELLKFRRIVPLLAGWSALIAGIAWLVTGPILGIVAGEHYLAVAAIAWLGVFAIGSVQLFLTRLFGSMGVIAGILFLMVLGMPASNMSLSIYSMPGFYRFLHEILPMAAIGESMRSVLYFGAAGVVGHLLVLAIGAVAGLGATAIWDRLRGHRHPEGVPTDVNVASLHGGRRPKGKFWRYATLLFFPLAMVTMMLTTMLGAMHQPSPKDMPVAVIGATTEQAHETIVGLEKSMGDMFDFTAYSAAETDDVRTLVENRELVAAFVLPSQASPEFTLIANQAGSPSAYQVADRVFTQVAAAQEMTLTIDDLAPLPDRDSQGLVTMYLAMGWMLAGFMVVIVAANAAPFTRPLRTMLPLTAVYAMFMSAVLWVIADPITGSVDGHFWPLWGAGAVTIFCVAMFAMVFERLIGMLAIIPAVGILMFLGVPSSNGAFSMYMAPDWFRTMHDYLPMPAAVEIIRSIVYFDGDTVAHNLQVLGLWGLVSLVVVFIIDALKRVRTEHDFGDLAAPAPAGGGSTPAAVDEGSVGDESEKSDESDGSAGSAAEPEDADERERELVLS